MFVRGLNKGRTQPGSVQGLEIKSGLSLEASRCADLSLVNTRTKMQAQGYFVFMNKGRNEHGPHRY